MWTYHGGLNEKVWEKSIPKVKWIEVNIPLKLLRHISKRWTDCAHRLKLEKLAVKWCGHCRAGDPFVAHFIQKAVLTVFALSITSKHETIAVITRVSFIFIKLEYTSCAPKRSHGRCRLCSAVETIPAKASGPIMIARTSPSSTTLPTWKAILGEFVRSRWENSHVYPLFYKPNLQ